MEVRGVLEERRVRGDEEGGETEGHELARSSSSPKQKGRTSGPTVDLATSR